MSPTVASAGLARALAAIAGEAYATEDPARTAAFAIDDVVPRAAVEPGSAEEVAAVLKHAHAQKLVVVPAGGLTHQHTGGIPRKINVLCDRLMLMGRLDEKHAFTGKDVATVIGELQEEFAPAGQQANEAGG